MKLLKIIEYFEKTESISIWNEKAQRVITD